VNDGDSWQPLRQNMPFISIRDLIVKDDDLAVATHGRGFWILDNITALRQWNDKTVSSATLFTPATATRVRYSMYTDTPVPIDEPMAQNPPDGAMIEYWLPRDAQMVKLEVLDAAGRVVRSFASSDPTPAPTDQGNAPWYWFRPAAAPSVKAGLQRFVWDLHYARPTEGCSLPISATPYNTKCEPEGPWVMPGRYTVRLTVDGATLTRSLSVRMDPRVTISRVALQEQHDLSLALYDAVLLARTRAADARQAGQTELAAAYAAVEGAHLTTIDALQQSDTPPTASMRAAARDRLAAFRALEARWAALSR
jgi:hypothetical protein